MSNWKMFSDNELMKLYWLAVETRNGRAIKAIKEEMSRRERET